MNNQFNGGMWVEAECEAMRVVKMGARAEEGGRNSDVTAEKSGSGSGILILPRRRRSMVEDDE